VFVHIQEVEKAGYKSLIDNQRIEYVLSTKKGKHCAVNLQLI
jgi:cold shock CspA family protein